MNFKAIALFLDIYEFKFNLITTEIKQLSFPHPTMNPIQTFQGVILIDFSIWTSFVGQKWLVFNTYAYKHLMQSLYQNNKWHSIIPTRIPIKQIRVFVINMISRDDANIILDVPVTLDYWYIIRIFIIFGSAKNQQTTKAIVGISFVTLII